MHDFFHGRYIPHSRSSSRNLIWIQNNFVCELFKHHVNVKDRFTLYNKIAR